MTIAIQDNNSLFSLALKKTANDRVIKKLWQIL